MEEIWKDAVGYEGSYQVSNISRVKSLPRRVYNGYGYFVLRERILKQMIDTKGYLTVVLRANNISKTRSVHQLVAEAFLNHRPNGAKLVVNHKDFVRTNNNVNNLEIITTRENTNQKHFKHSSQYTGVFWNKQRGKWQAQTVISGKVVYLGRFDDEYDAHMYYENAINASLAGDEVISKKRIPTSKHRGVSFNTRTGKWVSNININYKRTFLGFFDNELDAANAYNKKAMERNRK